MGHNFSHVTMDGHKVGEFTSKPSTTTPLDLKEDHVRTVIIESLGLDDDEWISLLRVSRVVGESSYRDDAGRLLCVSSTARTMINGHHGKRCSPARKNNIF